MASQDGQHSEQGTSNPFKICANLFITFIGAGVLGLPYAFKEAGILEGTFIMTLVGVISVKAMLLLVECKYRIIEKWETGENCSSENADGLFSHVASSPMERLDLLRNEELLVTRIKEPSRPLFTTMTGSQDISYGDVGFEALGSSGRLLVDFAIVLSQIGFCCAYLVFICKNMSDMIPQVEMGHWLLIILPVLSLLTLLRHLNSLALTSILAQCLVVFALSVVIWFDFEHFRSVRLHPREMSFENLPFFSVIAVYCFEGAGLVLSIEGSLAKDVRDRFSRYLTATLAAITLLYILFGVCGYLSFGSETKQIITLNLPKGASFDFSIIVKSFLCAALFCTYPVMMFPVMKILEHYFIPDAGKSAWKGKQFKLLHFVDIWIYFPNIINSGVGDMHEANILRGLVVLLTGMVVILVPNFADLIALVGACCCTLLLFIMPGLFHMLLFRGDMNLKNYAFDWLLILLGVLGTIFGFWNSIVHMIGAEVGHAPSNDASVTQEPVTGTTGSLVTAVQNVTESLIESTTDYLARNKGTSLLPVIKTTTEEVLQIVTHHVTSGRGNYTN